MFSASAVFLLCLFNIYIWGHLVIVLAYIDILQVKKVEDEPEPETDPFSCHDGDLELVEASNDSTVNVKGNLWIFYITLQNI